MLILVRHGQTTANAERRLAGHIDVPLTPLGRRQATAVAGALRGSAPIRRVIASPLSRARVTAEALGVPVEIDERWIELDYGRYDGMGLAEVPSGVWASWKDDPGYAVPGGESLARLGCRVRDACLQLMDEAAEANVVVVSHVSPIKAAVTWALDVADGTAWRMFLTTGSITRIGVGTDGPSLYSFNESGHLGDLASGG